MLSNECLVCLLSYNKNKKIHETKGQFGLATTKLLLQERGSQMHVLDECQNHTNGHCTDTIRFKLCRVYNQGPDTFGVVN